MKKSFKIFSKILAVSFTLLILISLLSCGSTRCTTKAGNYNTVNR